MFLVKIADFLNRGLRWVLAILLLGMVVSTLWQVIVRFLLGAIGINMSAPWTEEIARYFMIWVIFLGAAVACRKAQLISLDILVHSLPQRPGSIIRYFSLLVCLGFFGLMFNLGLQFLEYGSIEFSPVLSLPKNWIYIAMPVGFALMMFNTIALIIECFHERGDIRFAGQDLA